MKSIQKFCRKSGFTLIELMMTIIIVGIIAVPIALFLARHVESAFQSEDYAMATNLARLEMERVNNMDYDADLAVGVVNMANYQGYNYDLTRTIAFVQGNALSQESLKQITIDVRRSGSAVILYSLVTYIARNVVYGV